MDTQRNNFSKEDHLFTKISNEWWYPSGKFKVLHSFNKVRIPYIINSINSHFGLKSDYSSLKILDIGCGGGLISEEMAKLNANVVAIDINTNAINVAKNHANKNNLTIQYINTDINNMPKEQHFDVILVLEVLEHINELASFLKQVCSLLDDKGIIIFSTINRNLKSLILAKIVAEYVLKWTPKGIHNYKNFIKPFELQLIFLKNQCHITCIKGINYNFRLNKWNLHYKPIINYIGTANKNSYSS